MLILSIFIYFIGGYWCNYFINGVLVDIGGYFRLNYHRLLMVINGYLIGGY